MLGWGGKMLTIENAVKRFKKKTVLNCINLKLSNGIYGLLGPNGAGKTTLIRCITSLYSLNSGKISHNGIDIKCGSDFSKLIGYLPQKFGAYKELTLHEMLRYFGDMKQVDQKILKPQILKVLEEVNLMEQMDNKIKTLSGGMLRRLGIAQALLNDPPILIFDEPTAGLDPEERLRFKHIVAKYDRQKIVIISTHIVEDVEALCDHIIVMNKGQILVAETSEGIKKYAEKKVYTCQRSAFSTEWENCFVEKEYEKRGDVYYRFLTSAHGFGKYAEPNIEDGYLCILKNI